MNQMQTGRRGRTLRAGQFDKGASMKTAFLLLTSSLVIAASGAFAQGNSDACHNQYGSCMERCSTRPQGLKESCSNSCETNTNQCYSTMYGNKSGAQSIQTAPEQASAQAPEATDASDEAKPEAKVEKKSKKKKK
jgi:hypothetical protein